MSRARRVAHLIMLCLIAKYLLSDSYGPLDRFLEIGVFLLIAYEVIVGIVRHRGTTKRQRELGRIVASLSKLMDKGQALQGSVPDPSRADWPILESWIKSVDAWSGEMNAFLFLGARSARASASFTLILDSSASDRVVNKPGESFNLHGPTRECYQRLLVQLSNLRGIMEKPDVYF
jgi:hypothetical protein